MAVALSVSAACSNHVARDFPPLQAPAAAPAAAACPSVAARVEERTASRGSRLAPKPFVRDGSGAVANIEGIGTEVAMDPLWSCGDVMGGETTP